MQTRTAERLMALRNYSTAYEVTVSKNGETYLLGYTPRKSGPGIVRLIQRRWDVLCNFLSVEKMHLGRRTPTDIHGHGCQITFSGRTERDAICNGEWDCLPCRKV